MTVVSNEITNLQNQTAYFQAANSSTKANSTNDSNMFLNLMLQQMKHQDPTEPTDNTEWLSQLAQYSSLEQMTQLNSGISNCMDYIKAMYENSTTNAEITQTLSLIGKEVTLKDPSDSTGKKTVSGKVSEVNFENGTGEVKIGDNYYSIANIVAVKEPSAE